MYLKEKGRKRYATIFAGVMFFAMAIAGIQGVNANPVLIDDINTTTKVENEITVGISGVVNGNALYWLAGSFWSYDGVSTTKLLDSYTRELHFIGDQAYSIINDVLWKTDGTTAGTIELKAGDFPNNIFQSVILGNEAFFIVHKYWNTKLWKTDGTVAGTALLKKFKPSYSELIVYENNIYLSADDGKAGRELWKTDGTVSGTELVKDIHPDSGSGDPKGFTVYDDRLFFVAQGKDTGRELWVSDGTEAGTQLFMDIKPGGDSSQIENFTVINNVLYFTVYNQSQQDYSLWKTDGTVSGTAQVVKVLGGKPPFFQFNDELYFIGSNPEVGAELWKTDGTEPGTVMVKDIFSGLDSTGNPNSSHPENFIIVNNTLYFIATDDVYGRELWKTDGTTSGTILVKDILPGSSDGIPEKGSSSSTIKMTSFNNKLYFMAKTSWNDYGLWKTDGTPQGTVPIMDVTSGQFKSSKKANPAFYTPDLMVINDELHFVASTFSGGETWEGFWKTSGVNNDVTFVSNIRRVLSGSSDPRFMLEHNGKGLFFANDGINGYQLRATDGTGSWAVLDKGFFSVSSVFEMNGNVYFRATNSDDRDSWYWRTDGTSAGTFQIKNTGFEVLHFFGIMGNAFYFVADDETKNARALWKSDGTTSGTEQVRGGFVRKGWTKPVVANNVLYFEADDGITGRELWKSDGTTAGTLLVKDLWTGNDLSGLPRGSNPYALQLVGNEVYFTANIPSTQANLYKTDGTPNGTVQVVPNIGMKRLVGNQSFFINTTDAEGAELWKLDTTTNRTSLVKDINPGSGSGLSNSSLIGWLNDEFYFIAIDDTNLQALWKSDGTEAGTVIVSSKVASLVNSKHILGEFNNTLYFFGNQTYSNTVIWQTDGTESGSKRINYKYWNYISDSVVVNGDVYFIGEVASYKSSSGGLWRLDGTDGIATLVAENPGNHNGRISSILAVIDNTIYLTAENGLVGNELWRYSIVTPPGTAEFGDLVWNDLNADGVQDANEPGLPGISIELQTCSGQTLESTTSGTDGSFAFANLSPGNYQMQFTLPANHVFSPEKAAGNYQLDSNANTNTGLTQCYSMADGQERLSIDVGMIPAAPVGTGVLGNYVWSDLNGDGKQDSNEAGLANVSIDLRNCSGGYLDTLSTDTSGGFRFDNLVPGDYQMQFHLPANHQFSPEKAAGNYQIDSNVNPATGLTQCYSLDDDQERLAIDAGMVPKTVSVSDTVTISQAIYFTADNRLWIRATSDASPAGSANITATMVVNGLETNLGQVSWKADKGLYQHVFKNLMARPGEITLSSDLGGSASGYVRIK